MNETVEKFLLPVIGLLVMMFVAWQFSIENPFARHKLETCKAEVAEIQAWNETKAKDLQARRVSEYCQAVLQNHQ